MEDMGKDKDIFSKNHSISQLFHYIVRVIHTVQIKIIDICFTKTTHLGMKKNTNFLKYFLKKRPSNRGVEL
jgi:hypothetical protein